jgi:hypothetical protein
MLLITLFIVQAASAQYQYPRSSIETFNQYKDYPQLRGETQTLTEHALPSRVTLSGEIRSRTEDQTAVNLHPGQGHFYELERIRGDMELQPKSWLTGYVQFHDLHALGLPLKYTAANMRDNFDVRQAYLNFHYKPFQFFAGRQLLIFGNERVIGISDWTQTSRSFDGFDLRAGDRNRIDVFSASVVNIYPTSLDMHSGGLSYSGIYGSINTWVPRATVEPFVLMKRLPRVLSQQYIYGTETQVTPGLRIRGLPGKKIDYDVTGTLQRGSYSNDAIHSGSLLVKAGYMATSLPWKPHLLGEYDYATGNTHRNPERIGTFDQQYPSNHNAFGLVDLFGFQNLKQRRIDLDMEPYKELTLLFQTESLHATTFADGLYNGAGALFVKAPPNGFPSDNVGTGFDAQAKYVYHKYFVVQAGVGHFFPGEFMTHNGKGAPLTTSWLQLTYRFRMN